MIPMSFSSRIRWLVYGCLHRDPYVIAANVPGLMLGFFMTLSCYGFAEPEVSRAYISCTSICIDSFVPS